MRLLNVRTHRVETFLDDSIPSYAILSHTWGEGEVTFDDIQHVDLSIADGKSGWAKIEYVCKEALDEGFSYVWVDTCCIDKRSSSELSEAINSMFQWYASAHICYAYLPDVESERELADLREYEYAYEHQQAEFLSSDFARSRWFTRGWTLQELIAPAEISFFGKNWIYLGSNKSLSRGIAKITGIDLDILRSGVFFTQARLNATPVARKMSWAAKRKTSRVEDQAYCLLGIFGVNMPMVYGEGAKAFTRLQEEIIKTSDDQSIFAWEYADDGNRSLLAPSPLAFVNSSRITPWVTGFPSGPYSMTNKGLSITLPLFQTQGQTYAILACRSADDFRGPLALRLHNIGEEDVFSMSQTGRRFLVVDLETLSTAKSRLIFIQRDNFKALLQMPTPLRPLAGTGNDSRPRPLNFWVRTYFTKSICDVFIVEAAPLKDWNNQTKVFRLPERGGSACSLLLQRKFSSKYV